MTIFDLQAVTALLYNRIAYDAAGAAVRAILGAGSPSVIPASQLRAGLAYPDRPFIAFRAGAVGGATLDMRLVSATWWLYDDMVQGHGRINSIIQPLQAAYREGAIPFGRVEIASIGAEIPDQSLDLAARSVQLAYYRRG